MTLSTQVDIAAAFFRHAATEPDRPALCFDGVTHTYGDLMSRVQSVYEALEAAAGSKRVGIVVSPDLDVYAAILAVLASGRAYVPVHPSHPSARAAACLREARVEVLLQSGSSSGVQEVLSRESNIATVIDMSTLSPSKHFRDPVAVSSDDLAYILFTSGSTGKPKGVPIRHGNLKAFFQSLLGMSEFAFGKDDRFLQMFDLTFDLSIMSTLTPLMIGASAVIPSSTGPSHFAIHRALDEHAITVALMVPSVLTLLQRFLAEIRLPHLRYSLFCGEALPLTLVKAWSASVPNARIFNVYGPTEATIFCTSYEVPQHEPILAYHDVVSIGAPMLGTHLLVLDEQRNPVASEVPGDLYLAGPQVTDGYLNDETRTAEAFGAVTYDARELTAYRTGDIAFERDGCFFYCGRSDQQVKIAGYRVELGEIEFHARRIGGVADAIAVADVDAAGNTFIHLFLRQTVLGEETAWTDTALRDLLPSHMQPRKVHFVDRFPLNQNGKVDRKSLLKSLTLEGK